jgi:hypothetical protein
MRLTHTLFHLCPKRTLRLGVSLMTKELALADRVVQLGVGIAHLPPVDEELKALRHVGNGAMPAHNKESIDG